MRIRLDAQNNTVSVPFAAFQENILEKNIRPEVEIKLSKAGETLAGYASEHLFLSRSLNGEMKS